MPRAPREGILAGRDPNAVVGCVCEGQPWLAAALWALARLVAPCEWLPGQQWHGHTRQMVQMVGYRLWVEGHPPHDRHKPWPVGCCRQHFDADAFFASIVWKWRGGASFPRPAVQCLAREGDERREVGSLLACPVAALSHQGG